MSKSSTVISHWNNLIEGFSFSPKEFYAKVEEALARRDVPETQRSQIVHKEGGAFSARREYLRIQRGKHSFDICAAPFGKGFFVSSWLTQSRTLVGVLYLALFLVGYFFAFSFAYLLLFQILVRITPWAAYLTITLAPLLFIVGFPIAVWFAATFAIRSETGIDDAIADIPYLGGLYERIFRPNSYYRIDTAMMFQKSVHNAVLEVIDEVTKEKGVRALTDDERKPVMKEFYSKGAHA